MSRKIPNIPRLPHVSLFVREVGTSTFQKVTFPISRFFQPILRALPSSPIFRTLRRQDSIATVRFRCDPSNQSAHAAPPAAAPFESRLPETIGANPSTVVFLRTGKLILPGFFFGTGKSSTFDRHLSQYTPAPPSRTHSPPQCSQYFSSIRTSVCSLSSFWLVIDSSTSFSS
jgi:hypothetical protein